MIGEHPYVRWAIEVIENYVRYKHVTEPHSDLPEELFNIKAGSFVTLHKKDGSLRGCIGTFMPVRENLAYEIRDNAIAAATRDPRFPPVQPKELEDIVVNVDILSPYEEVKSIEELDPKKYGIIVQKGWKRGLLLPDIDGVDTVEEQLRIAKLKAGIYDDNFEVFKFTVERYR
ncbi:MAG TPA: AmmeMemoRadiSam system protein A [Fervidobacterium sp.]|nr:AMMECR1 domain-containing protein [Fervidobacterium sp.]HOK87834.1 AmmeMemoRadiSam system protein A [Fervidobacterium sp.]HPP17821.1 AmmeMemoRadiSam system protein A [Fervidobacterium sp.]HRD20322.1 AmmeMemoRadiSam system protein A [Fervidobacterium sp.]